MKVYVFSNIRFYSHGVFYHAKYTVMANSREEAKKFVHDHLFRIHSGEDLRVELGLPSVYSDKGMPIILGEEIKPVNNNEQKPAK